MQHVVICGQSIDLLAIEAGLAAMPVVKLTFRLNQEKLAREEAVHENDQSHQRQGGEANVF